MATKPKPKPKLPADPNYPAPNPLSPITLYFRFGAALATALAAGALAGWLLTMIAQASTQHARLHPTPDPSFTIIPNAPIFTPRPNPDKNPTPTPLPDQPAPTPDPTPTPLPDQPKPDSVTIPVKDLNLPQGWTFWENMVVASNRQSGSVCIASQHYTNGVRLSVSAIVRYDTFKKPLKRLNILVLRPGWIAVEDAGYLVDTHFDMPQKRNQENLVRDVRMRFWSAAGWTIDGVQGFGHTFDVEDDGVSAGFEREQAEYYLEKLAAAASLQLKIYGSKETLDNVAEGRTPAHIYDVNLDLKGSRAAMGEVLKCLHSGETY